jgi:hypothetical protein
MREQMIGVRGMQEPFRLLRQPEGPFWLQHTKQGPQMGVRLQVHLNAGHQSMLQLSECMFSMLFVIGLWHAVVDCHHMAAT